MKVKPTRKQTARELLEQALEYLNAAESMTQTFADDEDKIAGYQIGVSGAKWNLEQLMEVLG